MVIAISPGSSARARVRTTTTAACARVLSSRARVLFFFFFPKLVFNTVTIRINHRAANLLRSLDRSPYRPRGWDKSHNFSRTRVFITFRLTANLLRAVHIARVRLFCSNVKNGTLDFVRPAKYLCNRNIVTITVTITLVYGVRFEKLFDRGISAITPSTIICTRVQWAKTMPRVLTFVFDNHTLFSHTFPRKLLRASKQNVWN